jgi:cell division protein FtsN
VSKRRKRKPSRRERRTGVDRPVKRPAEAAEAAEQPQSVQPEDVVTPDTAPKPAAPVDAQSAVTAVFTPTTKSDTAITLEQQHVSHDLRRLFIQLGAFALVIVGLVVLNAQTGLIGHLGSWLFTLWE